MTQLHRNKIRAGAWKSICGGLFVILVGILMGKSIFLGEPSAIDYVFDGFGILLIVFGIWLYVMQRRQQCDK